MTGNSFLCHRLTFTVREALAFTNVSMSLLPFHNIELSHIRTFVEGLFVHALQGCVGFFCKC